ncbi:MAG: hypothetical protein HKP53_09255 [Eudoraea sp.]|nr:hypothetical protein [Eudoraea sp.]
MELLSEYFIPWAISNTIAIVVLVTAIRKPKVARLLFVLLFSWACWINYTTANKSPDDYLNYASLTPFDLYADFINGWFRSHITSMVHLIAFGQGLLAIGMLGKGWAAKLACIGAIVFFLAIVPLGIGSGFPATIVTSVAIYFIWKNDDLNYLWYFKTKKSDLSI